MKTERLIRAIKRMSDEQLLFHLDNCEYFLKLNIMLSEWKLAHKLLSAELEERNRQ